MPRRRHFFGVLATETGELALLIGSVAVVVQR